MRKKLIKWNDKKVQEFFNVMFAGMKEVVVMAACKGGKKGMGGKKGGKK
jgi:hypothetical protein